MIRLQSTAGTKSRKRFISTTQITVFYKRGTIEKHRNIHWNVNQTASQKKKKGGEMNKNRKDFKRKTDHLALLPAQLDLLKAPF